MNSAVQRQAVQRPARGGMSGVLLLGCVGVLALPSAVLAFGTSFQPVEKTGRIDSLQAGAETLADSVASLADRSPGGESRWPFTPAGALDQSARSVTVAVRVDPQAPHSIIVRGKPGQNLVETEAQRLRIAQTAFNLGVSRSYQNFAQQDLVQAPSRGQGEPPDLKSYSLTPGPAQGDSRFTPRLSFDEKKPAGRAPRTFAGDGGEVDVGGAYRVTDNLDVTAGVRYSQERERLVPLNDGKQQDAQAVYVGTQFRF